MGNGVWAHTAIVVLYDVSDGWYDHVMGPVPQPSSTPVNSLFVPLIFGSAPAGSFQGRCGYGPRQPLLVISPWARQNRWEHRLRGGGSIIREFENHWRR